jgi:hypothetical protein
MEKSPARLTDEAENERKKLSRETQAATGPVPDAISTENEEQITAANLERRRKIEWSTEEIECLDLGQPIKKIRPATRPTMPRTKTRHEHKRKIGRSTKQCETNFFIKIKRDSYNYIGHQYPSII